MAGEIDINNTYSWIAALQKNYEPDTFLRKNLFSGLQTFRGKDVLMDYRKGNRRMAPFVAAGNTSLVARDGFETRSYRPPIMAPSRVISAEALKSRAFGEDPQNPMGGAERAAKIRAEDLADLTRMIDRRIEWMCAQILINAEFTAKGYAEDGGAQVINKVTIDGFTQKKTLSGTDLWSNADADIYNEVNDVAVEMRKNGSNPTMMIANSTTISNMLKNNSLKNKMVVQSDLLNFSRPAIVDKSVVRYAVFTPGNIDVYGYDDVYMDDDGTAKPYIPDGYVIFASRDIGQILAASITLLMGDGEFHDYTGLYIPKEVSNVKDNVKTLSLYSASVPMVKDVDSWYTMKVL